MRMALRWYLELTKPAVTGLLVLGGVAGAFMDLAGVASSPIRFLIGFIGLYVAVSGANAVSNYIDRDIDAKMLRTCNRALPSGKVRPGTALAFGLALLILGTAVALLVSAYEAAWIAIGAFFDPFIYNYLTKRRTPLNIAIASPAGGAPIMAGWSLASGSFYSLAPFLLFIIVVVWTPVHIWSIAIKYSEDYRRAGVPMLPVVYGSRASSATVLAFSVTLTAFAAAFGELAFGAWAMASLAVLGAVMVALSAALFVKGGASEAMRVFMYSNLYLLIVYLLVIVGNALR